MQQEEKKVVRHDGEEGQGRFYEIDEVFYPSATTILEAYPMSFFLREFLQENTKEEAEKKKNEAAIRGSKIHHTLELVLAGKKVSSGGITEDQVKWLGLSDPKLVKYLQKPFTKREDVMMRGFQNFWEDYTPEVIESERIVWSKKWGFAGTLDAILVIHLPWSTKELTAFKKAGKKVPPRKKLKVLMDFKTGKALYPEYDMQVACYREAWKEMTGDKSKMVVGLLQLGINQCNYRLKIVKDQKKSFKEFLKVKEMWHLVNPNARPTVYNFLPEYFVKSK